jgi:hypothetical protein
MYVQSTRARGCLQAWRSCWTKQSRRTPALRRATKMTRRWSTSCAATPQLTDMAWTSDPQWRWSLLDVAASGNQSAGTAKHGSGGNGVRCELAIPLKSTLPRKESSMAVATLPSAAAAKHSSAREGSRCVLPQASQGNKSQPRDYHIRSAKHGCTARQACQHKLALQRAPSGMTKNMPLTSADMRA